MLKTFRLKLFFCFFIYANAVFAGNISQYKFIENKGQQPANVFYTTNVEGGNIYFEKNCLNFDFINAEEAMHPHKKSVLSKTNSSPAHKIPRHTYKVYFEGSNPFATISANSPTVTKYNYFNGKDQSKWVSGARAFNKIIYQDIYENISATYYTSSKNTFKYDFLLSPGANHKNIKLRYEGVNSIKLVDGNVVITTSLNQLTEQKPYAYQIINGRRISVPCNYVLDGNNLSFSFPKGYNKALPVVIDPEIIFSTYSGSIADNFGFCATYDAKGNAYSGGAVFSAGYPITTGAYQQTFAGGFNGMGGREMPCDIGIMKFSPDGTKLLYTTYLGGMGNERPQSMIVNAQNELIILGSTSSVDFPVTNGSYDMSYNDSTDIFISKLSSDGTQLISSTFFGGKNTDGINMNLRDYYQERKWLIFNYGDEYKSEIQVDANDNVIFVSTTQSTDFPLKNAFQQNLSGAQDACLIKLSKNLDSIIFSTYIGGDSLEAGYGLTISNDGSIYICGGTASTDFPVTKNSFLNSYSGKVDGFVSHFTSGGSLSHSTYIGTADYDQSYFIKWKNYKVFVCGQTKGKYPISANVFKNNSSTQFISILQEDLSSMAKSTVFGSGRNTTDLVISAFNVDACQNIYIAGWGGETNSTMHGGQGGSTKDLPLTKNAFQSTTDGSDFYIAVFAKDFDTLTYASYFGGNKSEEHTDGGTSRFDDNGTLYLTACGGCGGFSDWPTTENAYSKINKGKRPQTQNLGGCNQAILKMNLHPYQNFDYSFEAGKDDIQFYGPKAITYFWDFGDGTTSTERNPKKQFIVGKTYQVYLAIRTDCGNDTIYKEIRIWNTGTDEIESKNISIYPNPAQNYAVIQVDNDLFSKHFPLTLYMVDALGREVLQSEIRSGKSEINLQHLSSGMYYYTVRSGENVLSKGKLNITK